MELESDAVVETQILCIHRVAVNNAFAKRYGLGIAAPDEVPDPLRHDLPKSTEIILRQLFKMLFERR